MPSDSDALRLVAFVAEDAVELTSASDEAYVVNQPTTGERL